MQVGFKTLFLPPVQHKGGEWNRVCGADSMEELHLKKNINNLFLLCAFS